MVLDDYEEDAKTSITDQDAINTIGYRTPSVSISRR
jgi:hypothetical protein